MLTKRRFSMAAMVFGLAMMGSMASAADPSGVWKWSRTYNERTVDYSLKLDLDGEKLKGTLMRGDETVEIEGAVFEDDKLAFSVNRERNGRTITVRYHGAVVDDLIAGKVTFPGGDGKPREFDWAAKRVKE